VIGREETEQPWRAEGDPPEPVVEAVERLASTKGWTRRLHGARIHGAWREIAGERLAQHTEPVRLYGGVLVVRASSSAWAAQIPYLANEIIARANAVLGEGQVVRVVVAPGVHSS
jgi:predicted nucleic acid-binding Zn ribbon protein